MAVKRIAQRSAAAMGVDGKKMRGPKRVNSLHESNPMLGYPRMPARHRLPGNRRNAGARDLQGGGGGVRGRRDGAPEVMIPLVGTKANSTW